MSEDLNKQQKRNKPVRKKRWINPQKLLIFITFTIYIIFQLIASAKDSKITTGTVTMVELNKMIENNEVESVQVTKTGPTIYITKTNGEIVDAVNPQNDTFIYDLMEKGVNVKVQKKTFFDSMLEVVATIPIAIIMLMMIAYLSNTIVGGSTKMFTVLKKELNNTTFDDIRGLGNTKKEVQFIVNQLRNWKELGELGARPCKGALLYGPPGTGKTMLARAIAKEAGVSFISASGSDFNEVFVGVGAARVRTLWDLAMQNAPCVVFIDEIDCLGRRRKGGDGASNDHNQTLNALLQRMDGINEARGVMVLGATNRKEDLDPAILRPGRFDRHYYVGAPDNKQDRDDVVQVYLENKKVSDEVTIEKASKLMVGLSGAEIEQVLNESVYISLQDDRDGIIKLSDIDEAAMQLRVGGIKREQRSEHDEKITAIHEAGHTIAHLVLGDKVSKVSIVPYSSGVGGVTIKDPDIYENDKLENLSDFENDIKVLLAGKCAEELEFNEHSNGCSNDLERASKIVYNMYTDGGFDNNHLMNVNVLLENGFQEALTDRLLNKCNEELAKYNKETMELLKEHTDELHKLRDMLLKNKTIVDPTLEMLQ